MSTEQQAAETVHTRRALVVDDEPKVRAIICQMLERLGCDVTEAGDGEEALERVAAELFDVALIDVRLPRGREGLEVTRRAKRVRPDLHIIVITGIPTGDIAFQAGKEGADDFLPKPLDMEQLRVILDQLPIPPGGRDGERSLPWFIGDSPAIRALYRRIRERIAPSDETVLILGESGTGKELVAQAIHFWGPTRRRRHAFVAVNCSSVAEGVLMNELFGHEREAFTGAAGRRKGLIEQAHQGTLFLDEIGGASENLQMALLRVLEQGEVRRLGSSETIEVDVRIIAATNKHLEREISEGGFRKDLYYRLNVVPIDLPPLRDRTSTTASTSCPSTCRRCGTGRGTSPCCSTTSCAATASPIVALPRARSAPSNAAAGTATSASSRTSSAGSSSRSRPPRSAASTSQPSTARPPSSGPSTPAASARPRRSGSATTWRPSFSGSAAT